MAKTSSMHIRVEPKVKAEAERILNNLGMNSTEAINIYLRQIILNSGIPFEIKKPKYNRKTLKAMKEAEKIMKHPEKAKKFNSVEELMEDLNS